MITLTIIDLKITIIFELENILQSLHKNQSLYIRLAIVLKDFDLYNSLFLEEFYYVMHYTLRLTQSYIIL